MQLDVASAEVSASVEVYSSTAVWAAVAGCLLLYGLVVSASIWLGLRWAKKSSWVLPRISDLAAPIRLLVLLTTLGLLASQAFAAALVYTQTREVHESAQEYFQYLSLTKLLGMSHSHLFGYTLMFGLLGLFLCLSSAKPWLKTSLIALLLWSGIFDVLSWWGIKYVAPAFEWLAMATGTAMGLCSLGVLYFVVASQKATSA